MTILRRIRSSAYLIPVVVTTGAMGGVLWALWRAEENRRPRLNDACENHGGFWVSSKSVSIWHECSTYADNTWGINAPWQAAVMIVPLLALWWMIVISWGDARRIDCTPLDKAFPTNEPKETP